VRSRQGRWRHVWSGRYRPSYNATNGWWWLYCGEAWTTARRVGELTSGQAELEANSAAESGKVMEQLRPFRLDRVTSSYAVIILAWR